MGKTLRSLFPFATRQKSGAPLCSAFARRANSVERAHWQRPLPGRARQRRKEPSLSSPCGRMARGGKRTTDPTHLSPAAQSPPPVSPKPENMGTLKPEIPITRIALPPVFLMGYLGREHICGRRTWEAVARRRMGGINRTVETIWNDKKSSILMVAWGRRTLPRRGKQRRPPGNPPARKPAAENIHAPEHFRQAFSAAGSGRGKGRWESQHRPAEKDRRKETTNPHSAFSMLERRALSSVKRRSPPGRRCRQPVPSARWLRKPAPRAGGGLASFRFLFSDRTHTRRQAHEQGPAACGVGEDEEMVLSATLCSQCGGAPAVCGGF